MSSNECYRAAIETALGVPVKVFTPADYDGVIQGLLGGTLDMAWLGASAYAKIYLTDEKAVTVALTSRTSTIRPATIPSPSPAELWHQDGRGRQGQEIRLWRAELHLGLPRACGRNDRRLRPAGIVLQRGRNSRAGMSKPSSVSPMAISMQACAWADGIGNWEDGYTSGAFRKAADAGLVDMNNLVEIWRSKLIPEGPMVVRAALPADVKEKVTKLTADLWETNKECAYGVAAGEAKDFVRHPRHVSGHRRGPQTFWRVI